MRKNLQRTSRRTFLKRISGSIAATTIGAAGWSNISFKNNSRSSSAVFSEGQIGSLQVNNRLIRAATYERAGANGIPTDAYLKMIESLAVGGVGMIITGAIAAIPPGMETQIHVFGDQHIPEIEKIANAAHSVDNTCKIMAQLWHDENAGPSGISWTSDEPIRIFTVDEIVKIIGRFSETIRRVRDAGFDGVELNAHTIYTLSSFLSPKTNKRTDEYGGSIEKRVRMIREIVQQARVKVGSDFPILIKVNCDDSFDPAMSSEDGININNFPSLAAEIERAGVDAIELSGNTLLRKNLDSLDKESYFSAYTENLDIGIPVILTGGNRTFDHIEEILNNYDVDFFGLARPFIREKDLANRWLEGGGSIECKCISCNGCFNAQGPLHCVQEDG